MPKRRNQSENVPGPQPPESGSAPSPKSLQRHWTALCRGIGERRAGSAGDRAAADYILEQFRLSGLERVHAESFSCVSVAQAEAEVALGKGGSFRSVPARVLAGSPATAGTIEAGLVWIEMPEQAERLIRPALRGRIVVLFGSMPTSARLHQRLVRCRPGAVIHVDDRLPFPWVKDDGTYPAWTRRFGMPPIVTIPYQAAWAARQRGTLRARVRVDVELKQTTSQNVVAEIPGSRPNLPLILLGAHHDTQCHNVGADDNASGVLALLELARLLRPRRLMRTVRLVSFGAEEQLSVGSARYVAAHRRELRSIGVVLNFDSISSPLGHHWVLRAGTSGFGAWLLKQLARGGLDAAEKAAPMPFADHFPFSAFGVPSVTLMRPNMDSGMRWQHHSLQDSLQNVSLDELARVIHAAAAVTTALARTSRWPFARGLAPQQRAETRRLARELFDFA